MSAPPLAHVVVNSHTMLARQGITQSVGGAVVAPLPRLFSCHSQPNTVRARESNGRAPARTAPSHVSRHAYPGQTLRTETPTSAHMLKHRRQAQPRAAARVLICCAWLLRQYAAPRAHEGLRQVSVAPRRNPRRLPHSLLCARAHKRTLGQEMVHSFLIHGRLRTRCIVTALALALALLIALAFVFGQHGTRRSDRSCSSEGAAARHETHSTPALSLS